MVRPSFFLVCNIKVPSLRHRIVIPLPLWVLDDLLQAGFSIWTWVARFRPELPASMDRHLPGATAALSDVSHLFGALRQVGPFTLVEVDNPADGVRVSIKLV